MITKFCLCVAVLATAAFAVVPEHHTKLLNAARERCVMVMSACLSVHPQASHWPCLHGCKLLFSSPCLPHTHTHSTPTPPHPHNSPNEHFAAWLERHGKEYRSDVAQVAHRFKIWMANLEYVLAYNAKATTHWLGMTSLADLTQVCGVVVVCVRRVLWCALLSVFVELCGKPHSPARGLW